MMKPDRILVVRGGAVGDFVLTLPAISALRKFQASAQNPYLEVLGYPRVATLAVAAGLADATRSIESPSLVPFFARDCSISEEERLYFKRFDLIVSYLYDPDRTFERGVESVCCARFVRGQHRPCESDKTHATEVFLRPVRELGAQTLDAPPTLSLPPHPQSSEFTEAQWIATHPGSGSERKNWPEASWVELLKRLLEATTMNLFLIGGEAEGDRIFRFASRLPSRRIRLAQHLPLVELAQLLRCCKGFIGHDSGITHLAAAAGLPVLALWGETKFDIWRPIGPRVTILRHPSGLNELPVETVFRAAIEQTSI